MNIYHKEGNIFIMKNIIITLSGEEASGKAIIVKTLIEKLKKYGYSEEKIHLISTEDEFRRYYSSIIELIRNIENKEQLEEISKKEQLRDVFENKDYRNTITQVMINLKKEHMDLSKFTIQQANKSEAFKEIFTMIDSLIDSGMKRKGEEINREKHSDEIWITDSELAFHNIPENFSVRLTVNPNVAEERLFNYKSRGKEHSYEYESIGQSKNGREERRIGQRRIYNQRYGVDLEDENGYDLVVDTSYSSPSDVVDVILQCEKCYKENKQFSRKWASPKIFLPLQTERDTLSSTIFLKNIDELVENIIENGYYPYENIEVINVDGNNYIIEGHHRNFATAYAGKTLIPYEIIAKDDEIIPKYKNTARQRADSINLNYLYGHEWFIQKNDSAFEYRKMFPELYEKLLKQQEQEVR